MGGEARRFSKASAVQLETRRNRSAFLAVFPSPPGPLLPTKTGLARGRFARPNLRGEGEPRELAGSPRNGIRKLSFCRWIANSAAMPIQCVAKKQN